MGCNAGTAPRRRMRAVTGSSAGGAAGAGPLRGGLDGVGGFQGLDPLGELGDRRACCRLGRRLGEAGLELVA